MNFNWNGLTQERLKEINSSKRKYPGFCTVNIEHQGKHFVAVLSKMYDREVLGRWYEIEVYPGRNLSRKKPVVGTDVSIRSASYLPQFKERVEDIISGIITAKEYKYALRYFEDNFEIQKEFTNDFELACSKVSSLKFPEGYQDRNYPGHVPEQYMDVVDVLSEERLFWSGTEMGKGTNCDLGADNDVTKVVRRALG